MNIRFFYAVLEIPSRYYVFVVVVEFPVKRQFVEFIQVDLLIKGHK